MSQNLTLTVTETIGAPASAVWQALTDKEMIKQYFFGTEAESDWKVGSSIVFKGTWEGHEYEDKGTILELEEGKLIKYKYWSSMSGTEDRPENYKDVTYKLDSDGDKTVLTIIQEDVESQEIYEHSADNWKLVLNGLKELVEK